MARRYVARAPAVTRVSSCHRRAQREPGLASSLSARLNGSTCTRARSRPAIGASRRVPILQRSRPGRAAHGRGALPIRRAPSERGLDGQKKRTVASGSLVGCITDGRTSIPGSTRQARSGIDRHTFRSASEDRSGRPAETKMPCSAQRAVRSANPYDGAIHCHAVELRHEVAVRTALGQLRRPLHSERRNDSVRERRNPQVGSARRSECSRRSRNGISIGRLAIVRGASAISLDQLRSPGRMATMPCALTRRTRQQRISPSRAKRERVISLSKCRNRQDEIRPSGPIGP